MLSLSLSDSTVHSRVVTRGKSAWNNYLSFTGTMTTKILCCLVRIANQIKMIMVSPSLASMGFY